MNNKNFIEEINSFTQEDYENNHVNLHIHTKYSDGKAEAKDILQQAINKGYKKIAICDHNTFDAHKELQNDILIPAVEFDVWAGYVFCHILAYGIDANNKELQKFCAKSKKETECDIIRIFAKRDIKELFKAIHNSGGIAVLAHPACCWAINLENFVKKLIKIGLDGIEVYYPYKRHRGIIKFHKADTVKEIADKLNLIKTGGTDLHGKLLNLQK